VTAEVVLATSNPGKLREVREILAELPIDLLSIADFPGFVFLPEGDDYEQNAIAKARAASRFCRRVAIADDSGLEVFGLGGAPGPLSARFGGPDLDDAGRNRALLASLERLHGQQRRARYVCAAALANPAGDIITARGECEGHILEVPRGRSGFGYDPIFGVDGKGVTMAELPAPEKNRISHRAVAFTALSAAIRVNLGLGAEREEAARD
jgi:XTP/dITP diphosphohydrolase